MTTRLDRTKHHLTVDVEFDGYSSRIHISGPLGRYLGESLLGPIFQESKARCGIKHVWLGTITKGGKPTELQPPKQEKVLTQDEFETPIDPDDKTLTYAEEKGCLVITRTITKEGITAKTVDEWCCASVTCKKSCRSKLEWKKEKRKHPRTDQEIEVVVGAKLTCECPE